jgi:RHS repeat-associated protein
MNLTKTARIFSVLFASTGALLADSTQMNTVSVSAGQDHALALRSDGSVWSWGTNQTGQLGTGLSNSVFPVRVSGVSGVVGIGAGWNHSLAVQTNGTVWAWGTNDSGQLGNGTSTPTNVPVQVTRITNAIAVSGGLSHSLALLANGQVMSWGLNSSDQLGKGSTSPSSTNQPIFVTNLTGIIKISAGANHSATLDTNGVVWCWGAGSTGRIGNGQTTNVPVPLRVLSNVVDVVAGYEHTIALKSDGTVWIWGDNTYGELGIGNTTASSTPTQVTNLSGAQAIMAGFYVSSATLSNGQTYVWGFNNGAVKSPAPIGDTPAFVKLASIGSNPNSYLGLTADGAVWAWGANNLGQFGDNTTQSPALTDTLFAPTPSFAAVPPARWGEFLRGNVCYSSSANDINFCSIVVPIDLEQGVALNRTGSDAYCYSNQIPWFLCISNQTLYLPDSTNGGTTNLNIFPVNNPVVAFGSQGGGSALNLNQPYRFGVYAGGFDESTDAATNVIKISVYDQTLFNGSSTNIAPLNTFTIPLPRRTVTADSNAWYSFMTNGASVTVTSNGLTTTVEFLDSGDPNNKPLGLSWLPGQTIPSFILTGYKLTHTSSTTNYFYKVEVLGKVQVSTTALAPMATNASGVWTPTPLYTLDFAQPDPLQSIYVSRLFFDGTPKPPTYEQATFSGPNGIALNITNVVLTNSIYTNVDNSPELRRHPVLDQFVADMNNDPLALASYVINEIELTDPYARAQKSSTVNPIITCGGVDRSALGTFLEGQGSPIEQCELLVYLLRQAGYPAAYVFPTNNNLFMLDSHISQLWRVQVQGVVNSDGIPLLTNSLLTVNYPWVVANIGTNTVHIFPWLKDTSIEEGVNLYDYMPTNYNTALKWVENYVRGDSNILSLDSENVVSKLFPEFVQQYLNPQDPTFSLDALGVRAYNRRHQFPTWAYLPQPDLITNTGTVSVVDVLTNTTSFPYLANMFNTVQVQVYSNSTSGTLLLNSGTWYSCDYDNRKLLLFTNNGRLSLWLAPYTTNVSTVQSFSGPTSPALQSNSVATGTLTSLAVQTIHHRKVATLTTPYNDFPISEATGATNLSHCNMGDTAAIALDFGRVTPLMLEQHAETYWGLQRQRAANTNFVPNVWDYNGTAAYLLGMGYFQKNDAFDIYDQQWHKVHGLIKFSSGLGVIGACPTATNMQAKVDMFNNVEVLLGNASLRPDSAVPELTAAQNYFILNIAAGSAQEHDILQTMFPDQSAVSTVRLLQLAQARATNGNSPILELVNNSVVAAGNQTYGGYPGPLKSQDASMWVSVTNIFTQVGGDYARVLITPGMITNAAKTYIGMGALVLSYNEQAALISGNVATLNGGWGSEQPGFYTPPGSSPTLTMNLNSTASGLTFQPFNPNSSSVFSTLSPFDSASLNGISGLILTPEELSSASLTGILLGQSGSSPVANTVATESSGLFGAAIASIQNLGHAASDPVDVVSGGFYVDAVDLSLPGPFPLQLRRNYLSQNLDANEFGYGWKINFTPYLVLGTNSTLIYAAELDGTVLAYHLTNGVWKVFPQDNPSLNNNSTYGMGSTANLFNSTLRTNNGTNYIISAPDGSTRTYQVMTFSVSSGTNTLNRTRPYLTQWQDHSGNYALFLYGTNPTADDWGQLNRINMANGNTLVFKYDFYGRIIQAFTGDGRFVNYLYDNYGDLVTVTLPDASQCQYQYHHYTFTTNSTTYTDSDHLMIQEIKPNGRIVANNYDSLRRVTNQMSTVGTNLVLTTNAYFYYTNNVTSLTNQFASGATRVEDFFHNPTVYFYTNNLITNTVDPLNKTAAQIWFPDAVTNLPGYYPRSVQFTVDRRGLTNQFYYDTNGNVTQMVVMGNLTGEGNSSQVATNTSTYTSNNLPSAILDPVGNGVQLIYDSADPFRASQMVHTSGGTPVSTNLYFYTNVSQVSPLGATNSAFGLRWREVNAGATNDYVFNGNGFPIQLTKYPASTDNPFDADPPIVHYFSYNLRGQMYQDEIAGGATTQVDFDPMGRMTSRRVFDQNNNSLSTEYFYYNQDGELEWYDGPRSNPEDYVYHIYDAAGREIQQISFRSQGKIDGSGVEAPAGSAAYSTLFRTFDGFGNQTSVTDARGVVTTNQFDALGQVLQRQVYDANETLLKTEKFAYEPGGLITVTTNALGGTNQTLYTQTGKPYRSVGPDGATNGMTYYLDGRPKREYLANGSFWQSIYDDVNLLTTRVFYNAGGTPLETNITGLDRRGNQILQVDGLGNSFTNIFDGLNRLKLTGGPMTVNIQTNLPGGPGGGGNSTNIYQQTSTNYYDAAGLATTNFDALGNSTITYLDVLGRVIDKEIHDPANNLVRITTTAYSADHQSQTVTQGTGASAIVQTIYTDNAGKPVLAISYPSSGVKEFVLDKYDQAENLTSETHNSVSSGAVTTWTTTSLVNDGLNRVISKTDRDGAVTTYGFDAASDPTNRTMPGGLVWQATYNSAQQKLYDCNIGSGGSVTRSNSYTYSTTTGLLQTAADGRGVTCTHYYDAFLRPASNVYSGPLPEHNMTTSWSYDPRSLVTSITEGFASPGTGPSVSVTRQFDGYSELVNDTITGGASSAASQGWDAAGRRTGLGIAGGGFGFGYQADGLLASITGGGSYTYSTSGLLLSRTYSPRVTTISQRDGDGRPLAVNTTVNGTAVLSETATYLGDGLMATHSLVRSDFTDNRSYSYANLSRRLTQETVGLSASSNWTTAFVYDSGIPSGPGVLTSMGQAVGTNVHWNGGVDGFSRVSVGTNSVAQRQAYGFLNGTATMTALLDGNQMPVTTVGTNDNYEWRAQLQLTPGAHQLIVNALNWSGYYTASATNIFTNNAADRALDSYAGNGEITNRVWLTSGGLTNATESLSFDARDRLHTVTYLDSNTNGYSWSAIYDGLGRRMSTTTTFITNGVVQTNFTRTIGQYFDPQVQFLEVAETDGGVTTLKFYGPNVNGVYGGMQGVGGLEAVVNGPRAASPVINDIRGNALATYSLTQGSVTWFSSRVTAYGAVPGYAPLPLGDGAKIVAASAWRGKWADITGLVWLGGRYYDPTAGRWLSFDPSWNESDPNGFTFCGGEPVNGFDPDGRFVAGATTGALNIASGTLQLGINTVGASAYGLTSIVSQNAANTLFGPEQQGFNNTVNGVGNLVTTVANTAGYAVTSTFDPNTAYQAYGSSVQQFGNIVNGLTGGSGQSTAYQAGYTASQIGAVLLGGELGELGEGGEVANTTEDLSTAAQRATQTVGPGSGPVYGTYVHSAFQSEVDALGNANLATEQSYLNGNLVPRGTPGSVRVDVVEGPLNAPTAIYDLKTGSAQLTPARIQQIQANIPGGNNVPVIQIRP